MLFNSNTPIVQDRYAVLCTDSTTSTEEEGDAEGMQGDTETGTAIVISTHQREEEDSDMAFTITQGSQIWHLLSLLGGVVVCEQRYYDQVI